MIQPSHNIERSDDIRRVPKHIWLLSGVIYLIPVISGDFLESLGLDRFYETLWFLYFIPSTLLSYHLGLRGGFIAVLMNAIPAGFEWWQYKTQPEFELWEMYVAGTAVTGSLISSIGVALIAEKLRKANARLLEFSITDGLTGAFNYRHFHERLEQEIKRSSRTGSSLGLLVLDVDDFKRYNDTYGHPAGDHLLRELTWLIRNAVRSFDIIGRWGGDEFAVALLDAGVADANRAADRIRLAAEGFVFGGGLGEPLRRATVSIGVAGFPENGKTREELISAADQALYRAKLVKNTVRGYDDVPF